MKITPTALAGVLILEPRVFGDARGFFLESYNRERFESAVGFGVDFVQDNHSQSTAGVLRGLHYQMAPQAQAKLVRVICGEIFDVAVDVRSGSPTLGHWVGVRLSAENFRQLWIPEGFAHGFVTLSEQAEVLYKASRYWSPAHERCIAWDDPALAIEWPLSAAPVLSDKDRLGVPLARAELMSAAHAP